MRFVRSLLFGSKFRIALTIVAAIVAAVGAAAFAGVLGAPNVVGVENRFGDVNASTTAIETDLVVENPNPFGVSLDDVTVEYVVEMNGVEMAHGQKEGVAIESGNTTVPSETEMDNTRIPAWWASHVASGEHTDLAVRATVHSGTLNRSIDAPPVERSIETDFLSAFDSTESRPVNADRPLVGDPVLWINRTSADWGEATTDRTPIEIEFVVYNPKPWAIPITELGSEVSMNDVDVGEGETDETYVIPPGSTETVRTTVVIENDQLDDWWVSHLQRGEVTDLRIDFWATVDLSEAGGGEVQVPLDELTYVETFETDVFGTKNASASDGGGSTDDGSTDETEPGDEPTATSTPDSATPTPTPTATPTPTPEPTTTEDDDLLALPPRPGLPVE